ncbi:MAG: hypothetical protein ACTJHT_08650 [Sphingobacterium sp.]
MIRIKNIIAVSVITFMGIAFSGCQQTTKQTASEDPIADSLEIPVEETPTVIDEIDSQVLAQDSIVPEKAHSNTVTPFKIREGKHNISLQWISWDNLGEAEIKSFENNTYRIDGEQTDPKNGDYLKIHGTLEPISEKELKFVGTVATKSASVNRGEPCVKEGEQQFLSTKNRKYWRMQDMENCEGGMVVDYVDIYF